MNKSGLVLKLLTYFLWCPIRPHRMVTHLGLIFSPFSWRVSKTSFPFRTRRTFSLLSSISTNMYSTCKKFQTQCVTLPTKPQILPTGKNSFCEHCCFHGGIMHILCWVNLPCKLNNDKAHYSCFSKHSLHIHYESEIAVISRPMPFHSFFLLNPLMRNKGFI